MLENSISLESLLETHERPFVIIDASLTIVGLNKAWEQRYAVSKKDSIGQSCCQAAPNCRHHELFQKLEPYVSTETLNEEKQLVVRGYPLLDKDGTVYLGESVIQSNLLRKTRSSCRMAGSSKSYKQYRDKLLKAAKTQAPVFLMGETGTGKELASEFIHSHSKRASQELVVVDCTVLTEALFESELFGHEKGAFTGAVGVKKGLFELADKSTLFLDEIGELPLSQQPKLLRALETGEFRRVGSTTNLKSDIRVVCATHRNLANMVKTGEFREDLFYRLSVFPIQIPPLRERLKDIPEITDYLLKQIGRRDDQDYSISKEALIKLLNHQWPGNIRELKNCLQLACSLCENQHISESDISYMQPLSYQATPLIEPSSASHSKGDHLQKMESDIILALLQKYQGNRKLIATEMDISERTLYRKLKRFELN
jgi:transcriptional regulator with PAS, ATPase and Fis domain